MKRMILAFALALTGCSSEASSRQTVRDVELALLQDHENGTALLQYNPLTYSAKLIATFDSPFEAERVYWALCWNAAGTHALAWFDQGFTPSQLPHRQKVWEVDVRGRTSHVLPKPPLGEIMRVGFDLNGMPLIATEHRYAVEQNVMALSFEGKDYPVQRDGKAISLEDGDPYNNRLRHAFGWSEGKWGRLETKAIRLHDDATMGEADGLRRFQGIAPRGSQLPLTPEEAAQGSTRLSKVQDPERLKALNALSPSPGGSRGWVEIRQESQSCYLKIEATHTAWLTTPLVFEEDGNLYKADLKLEYDGLIYLQDHYLLLNGAPTGVALVDLQERQVRYESPSKQGVTFWPVSAE